MNRAFCMKILLAVSACIILLPLAVLLYWSLAGRWPWPSLQPQFYSLRAWKDMLFGPASLPLLLLNSIGLAALVAVLGTLVAILTSRATELHTIPGRSLIRFGTMLPLLIPGTVFTMGIQIVLVRMGLSDTLAGLVLVHLVMALPYCILVMTDITHAVGDRYEEQAAVLGASPLRAFWLVSLPSLLPGILSSLSMGFILSYSQYFTTLLAGGGRIRTIATVLVPYIQSGDRPLAAAYSAAYVMSALLVFAVFERWIRQLEKAEDK